MAILLQTKSLDDRLRLELDRQLLKNKGLDRLVFLLPSSIPFPSPHPLLCSFVSLLWLRPLAMGIQYGSALCSNAMTDGAALPVRTFGYRRPWFGSDDRSHLLVPFGCASPPHTNYGHTAFIGVALSPLKSCMVLYLDYGMDEIFCDVGLLNVEVESKCYSSCIMFSYCHVVQAFIRRFPFTPPSVIHSFLLVCSSLCAICICENQSLWNMPIFTLV